ncbi:amidase family protein [Actinokineospora auranticolor]|uniref:amidase family protein n=1 Tax=Actinokineospora auranticolor TaxID=155976 RepID=UPI001FE590AE|nr:amidase family protein [Actinokineospora auranticolor]
MAGWWDLDGAERARRVGEAAAQARGSAHGDWIEVAKDLAPGEGVLAGIPFSVKDNIDVRGFPTTAGSRLIDDSPAAVDAAVVSALRDAGAVVLGKTNLHELAFGITSNNAAFGPVRNPADPTRSAGGSSGGSAVGVALGVVPFALGTDTGGSVTIPAAYCGVVGFRPTTGRYPGDGVVNLSTSRDTIGIHAHAVLDVRVLDEIITGDRGAPASLEGLRIGLPRHRFLDLEPEIADRAATAVAALERAGAVLVDVELDDDVSGDDLVFHETPRLLARRTGIAPAKWPKHIASPDVRAIIARILDSPITADAYEAARAARWRLRRDYSDLFDQVDLLAYPTSPVLPPLLGQDDTITLNGRELPVFPTVTRNVSPGTVAGLPMISLPVSATAGICLESRPFTDARLLGVAEVVQSLLS